MRIAGRQLALACSLLALACAPLTAEPASRPPSSSRAADASEEVDAARVSPRGASSAQAPGPGSGATTGIPASRDLRLIAQAEEAYIQLAAELAGRSNLGAFTGRLANWPVTGPITSPFAPRWGGFHNGLDIAAPMLTPVRASAPGQVVVVGRPYLAFGDTGVIVIVAHGSNFSTLYSHLDDIRLPPVRVGERLAAGAVLGFVGVTGWTTGPHVHFMTIADGRAVDPMRYLP